MRVRADFRADCGAVEAFAYPSPAGHPAAVRARSVGREALVSIPRAALPSRVARAVTLVVALLVVLTGWLLAAPPGASPDDGYHLGSIWCADGF